LLIEADQPSAKPNDERLVPAPKKHTGQNQEMKRTDTISDEMMQLVIVAWWQPRRHIRRRAL
jgi:hypothetical protein